jgi:hypothetical protein
MYKDRIQVNRGVVTATIERRDDSGNWKVEWKEEFRGFDAMDQAEHAITLAYETMYGAENDVSKFAGEDGGAEVRTEG